MRLDRSILTRHEAGLMLTSRGETQWGRNRCAAAVSPGRNGKHGGDPYARNNSSLSVGDAEAAVSFVLLDSVVYLLAVADKALEKASLGDLIPRHDSYPTASLHETST